MKRFIYSTITIVIILFGYYLYDFFSGFHKTDWDLDKEYLWLFKDSVQKQINTDYGISCIGENDIISTFHYKSKTITAWEFKNIKKFEEFELKTSLEICDGSASFSSYEMLNKKSNLPITIKKYFSLGNKYRIKLDKSAKIHSEIHGENYKGICVSLTKFSLNDEYWNDQIIFDFLDKSEKVFIIIYYTKNSSFLFLIESKEELDLNSYKLLNLSPN